MPLNIVFGWHLDGVAYPETCSGSDYDFGGIVAGPTGLIQQLAIRLGLVVPAVPQAVRIAKYMSALKDCDNGSQFYSRSFTLDPWSTASYLLVMRDQLIAAGWNGQQFENSNSKLRSISEVERTVRNVGCPAETFRAVLQKLRDGRLTNSFSKLPIASITLATPPNLLPKAWQELLDLLELSGVIIKVFAPPKEFDTSTDLGRIQTYLVTGSEAKLKNDGSFTLVEADDEYQLAEVTASWIQSQENKVDKLLILRDSPTAIVDAFCTRYGLPRLGGHNTSNWRSALQVLPLMLETCWLPANPYRTLELISIPQGPIPRSLSFHFIKALRVEPGFGGERWAAAWSAVKESLESQLSEKLEDPTEVQKGIASTVRRLQFWLSPKRHDPSKGMPVEQAIEICKQVDKWASTNATLGEASEMFLEACAAAQETAETLAETGLKTINKIQLDRILDAVSGEGCKPENWYAQAAGWSLVDHPGQIWGTSDSLLWWGFTSKSLTQFQSDPWTSADLKILGDAGVFLDRPALAIQREAHGWKQALLHAKKEVLLTRARVESGESAPLHSLWHELERQIEGARSSIVLQAQDILSTAEPRVGMRKLQLTLVSEKSVPAAYRDWSSPPGIIARRSEESVSSLRDLLGCPMAWTLKYHAQLHPGILLDLPDGDRLIGDIGHKLFRQLFKTNHRGGNLEHEAEVVFDQLVDTVGLPLLLAGRETDKQEAKKRLVAAALQFAKLIQAADLEVVACEANREKTFGDGKFKGDLDIILRDRSGKPIVLDYKWSKEIRYRIKEIEEGQHLQLAAYAWLESDGSNSFAHVGYYMLGQRRLIHCGDGSISVGQEIGSLPLSEVWQRAVGAYEDAMNKLGDGSICATGVDDANPSGLEPVSSVTLEPPCKFCNYGNLCGQKGIGDE